MAEPIRALDQPARTKTIYPPPYDAALAGRAKRALGDVFNLTQFTEGGQGIEASASFTGHAGYDVSLSAEATGNSATTFACSECRADFNVNSRQSNASDVSATTNATITGSGRSVVSNARATGNSATYYVTTKR